jgi:hypothetical protein
MKAQQCQLGKGATGAATDISELMHDGMQALW